MPTVGCHTIKMVTRLNNVTVIARRAVVMSTSKVVLTVYLLPFVSLLNDTEVVFAALARHPIQGGPIGI